MNNYFVKLLTLLYYCLILTFIYEMITTWIAVKEKTDDLAKKIRERAFSSDQPVQHTKLLKFKNILLLTSKKLWPANFLYFEPPNRVNQFWHNPSVNIIFLNKPVIPLLWGLNLCQLSLTVFDFSLIKRYRKVVRLLFRFRLGLMYCQAEICKHYFVSVWQLMGVTLATDISFYISHITLLVTSTAQVKAGTV